MTTPTLPSYAKILFAGYQQQRESALLRTDMESGPPRQNKVRSRVMVTRTCNLFFDSEADFNSFETWYAGDAHEGSLWFNFTDPVSGSVKSGRFVGGGYTATPLVPDLSKWQIDLKIETWG